MVVETVNNQISLSIDNCNLNHSLYVIERGALLASIQAGKKLKKTNAPSEEDRKKKLAEMEKKVSVFFKKQQQLAEIEL